MFFTVSFLLPGISDYLLKIIKTTVSPQLANIQVVNLQKRKTSNYEQRVEVAHVSSRHHRTCAAVCLPCSAVVYRSTVLSQSLECVEAGGKAAVMWQGLLASAKQHTLYICVKGV